MATLGHIAIGMAAGRFYSRRAPTRLAPSMTAFGALSMLPDADVAAFAMGIPYSAPFGHRGAFHSLAFAALAGVIAGVVARADKQPFAFAATIAAITVATHGMLDTLTDGGLGMALFWPFTDERFFAPWQPLPVAPLGARFFTARGIRIALLELAVFSPLLAYALTSGRPGGEARPPAA